MMLGAKPVLVLDTAIGPLLLAVGAAGVVTVDVFTAGSCTLVVVVNREPAPASGLLSFPVMLAVESNATGVIFPVEPDFCSVLIGRTGDAVGVPPSLCRLESSLLIACVICRCCTWVNFGNVAVVDAPTVWLIGFLTVLTGGVFIGVIVSVIGRLSGFGFGIGEPATVDLTGVIVVVFDSVLPPSGCELPTKLDCFVKIFNGFINLWACCCCWFAPISVGDFSIVLVTLLTVVVELVALPVVAAAGDLDVTPLIPFESVVLGKDVPSVR